MLRSLSCSVRRRGPVFWFRKAVPVDLIDRLGRSDIRRSLRTCNLRVAKQRAWSLILLIEDAFAELRAAGFTPGARAALDAILNQMMDDFDRDEKQWSQRLRYRSLIESLGGAGDEGSIGHDCGLATEEISAPSASPRPVTGAPMPGTENESASTIMQQGLFDPTVLAKAVLEEIKLAQIHPRAHGTLTSFLPEYLAILRKKNRGAKYMDEVARKTEIFVATIGDKPVHEYGKADLLGYRDIIDQMPVDAIKHLKTDNPKQAIKLNNKRDIRLPMISSTTVDAKYLSALRGLFGYLVEQGILENNPCDKVRSQRQPDGEDRLDVEVRLPFTSSMLMALVAATSRKSRVTPDFWWPRVLPQTGLRINEFVQLSVADFREHHGRMCIDLLHHDDGMSDPVNIQRRGQLKLKSQAARRIIPLAQELIDGGFLNFVEKRRKKDGPLARLFPNETPDKFGNLSSAFSKRANRVVRAETEDSRYVVYSARHSFAEACDAADLPAEIRNRLMGHEPEKDDDTKKSSRGRHVSGRYGSPLPPASYFEWFDKIRFGAMMESR